ncbi:signal peptide peptidase SppA [Gemmatimonas aurantiaca]|nr:signal peptide peptidase SppA [Gemmatimonas aurantiaca]
MAKRRDIIVGLVIGGVFLFGMILFGVVLFTAVGDRDDFVVIGSGQIAVVEIYGGIYDSSVPVRQIKKWAKRSDIEAIVIHINSPGGGVAASHEIYEAIVQAREEYGVIVVASMSSVAASGGYYIACAADQIVANPGTLTGSIGVIMQFPTFGELLDKVGVRYETIKSGDLKDVGNPSRSLTEEEEQMLRSVIMDTYEQFVRIVATGREMDIDDVYPLADGRIYTGLQAYNLGLVDTLGTFDKAIEIAADLAGIEGDPETVKETPRKPGLFEVLTESIQKVETRITGDAGGPQLLLLYR